jgi:hypothetical protein
MRGGFLALAAVLGMAASAEASYLFSFSGSSSGGTGSAEMSITITGSALTLTLDNTSPTTLDNGTGDNAAAITGFGFNIENDPLPPISSWSLTAYESDGDLVQIGGTSFPGFWTLDTFFAGVSLDFLPHVQGIKGAIYNPDAEDSPALAAQPNYFSTATFVLNFNTTSTILLNEDSTFVRFQNVGLNGAGSLKTTGEEPPDITEHAPEPSSVILMLGGMAVGCATRLRRRRGA